MKWKNKKLQLLNNCGIFKVNQITRVSENGSEADFVVLDVPNWVNVIAIIENEKNEDCFLMVRQFRHGTSSVTCEFPAGAVDEGESAVEAAARELREETGYEADTLEVIGEVSPNPAVMNNKVTTVYAHKIKLKHKQDFDEHEDVEPALIPVYEVEQKMGAGEYDNGVMLIAMFYYQRWKYGYSEV